MTGGPLAFRYYLRVRYIECDAQKVVFNSRYSEYVDVGINEFLRALGVLPAFVSGDLDFQLVKQTIEDCLYAGELGGHLLAERLVVPELLRLDAADDSLGLVHQHFQLLIGADVEMAEPLEKLADRKGLDFAGIAGHRLSPCPEI